MVEVFGELFCSYAVHDKATSFVWVQTQLVSLTRSQKREWRKQKMKGMFCIIVMLFGIFKWKIWTANPFPSLQNIWKYSQFETKRRASWGTKNENVDTKCTELVPNNCFVSSFGTDTTALYTQPHYYAFYPVSEDVVSPTMNAAEFKHRKPCALYELVV